MIAQILKFVRFVLRTYLKISAARLRPKINLRAANPKSAQADWIARLNRLQTALDE